MVTARTSPKRQGIRSTAPGKALASVAGHGLPELDRIIHERMRLGIVSALAANETLSFRELKGLLATTDGNLSVHARKLEDAGYIACTKTFAERMPRTEYRLTPRGRRAFERYLGHLEALVAAARSSGGLGGRMK